MDDKQLDTIVDNLTGLVRLFHFVKPEGHETGFKPLPLDPHYWALFFLQMHSLTMSELGNRLYRSKPNMTAIIDKLIAEKLVTRLTDENDRRIIRIAITDQGKSFIKDKKKEMKEALKLNMASLNDEDLTELGLLLHQMNQLIIQIGERHHE
jgi:DNA-binding MarR family transcriptional regulator